MRGENIILVVVGLTLLYISHLLQTSRLRLSWEGFQDKAADAPKPAEVPKPPAPQISDDEADMKIVPHIQKLCAGPQDKESIFKGIKEIRVKQTTAALTESMGLGSKEGFQSHQNPYNEPSPNTQQAFEFRLGRMSMIN
jgi:hypothetical protein